MYSDIHRASPSPAVVVLCTHHKRKRHWSGMSVCHIRSLRLNTKAAHFYNHMPKRPFNASTISISPAPRSRGNSLPALSGCQPKSHKTHSNTWIYLRWMEPCLPMVCIRVWCTLLAIVSAFDVCTVCNTTDTQHMYYNIIIIITAKRDDAYSTNARYK